MSYETRKGRLKEKWLGYLAVVPRCIFVVIAAAAVYVVWHISCNINDNNFHVIECVLPAHFVSVG